MSEQFLRDKPYKYYWKYGERRWRGFFHKEPGTVKWVKTLTENDIFIDVGANIGIYTICAAYRCYKVYAFEPYKPNYQGLSENVALNPDLKNVRLFHAGLGERNEDVGLKHREDSLEIGGSGHQLTTNPLDGDEIIRCYTLDMLSKLLGWNKRDNSYYLKIDVDGIENKIIRGGENFLQSGKVKQVLCECNPDDYPIAEMDELFKEYGFKLRDKQYTSGGVKRAAVRKVPLDSLTHNRLYEYI